VAYEQPGFKFTLIAAADLRTHQYKFCNIDGTGKAALGGAGTRAVGVIQNKPNSGEATEICHTGISKVKSGAGVTVGDVVMSDSTGRAITATSTNHRVGIALATAGGADVLIPVLIQATGTVA
jgi:predicted RecA/RadA family phage recombinase